MEFSNSKLLISEIETDKWYYIEAGLDNSNEVTGIKLMDLSTVQVKFIGGDFENPFRMQFNISIEAFNEAWQYTFQEDYPYELDQSEFALDWINEWATLPYTMINDLNLSPKHVELVEE
jgi:hypothetical protein